MYSQTIITSYFISVWLNNLIFKNMFNDEEIDKTPTVIQIKAIIKYLEDDQKVKYDFTYMMDMNRIEPNKILLNLNDAYNGNKFEILFNDQDEIVSFVDKGYWIS